jgi:16S rRNA G966 N2-methylase RsmD
MNLPIVKLIRENLSITGLSMHAEVLHMDSFRFLQNHATPAEKNLGAPVRAYDMIYVAPPQYQEMAARALGILDSSPLVAESGLVIVQVHPKERPGVVAVPLHRLAQTDERRYGSSLLLFYKIRQSEEAEIFDANTSTDA